MEMELKFAPIILFVYKRLAHTKQVIDALLTNPEAPDCTLIVYSDAPKTVADADGVYEVRNYLKALTGFGDIHIIEREVNWGIEKSEISGITEVLERYGQAIILEDDIQVGSDFLKYMNAALEKYKENERVFSVTGYSFLKGERNGEELPEYTFVQLTSAWGWGTWAHKWKNFSEIIDKKELRKLCRKDFRETFDHGYPYAGMLIRQYLQGAVTWDMLWYWAAFKNNGLTLAPIRTKVNNIGMDGSGVHYTDSQGSNRVESLDGCFLGDLPDVVKEDPVVRQLIKREFQELHQGAGKNSDISLLQKYKEWMKWRYYWVKLI